MTLSENITAKVRYGADPSREELRTLIEGYLAGSISKEEMTAFLLSVCECGISDEATAVLTDVMLCSGERLSFTPRAYPYADKHSTGGLADSTTLIVAPIVASCGVPFLKMSGRKLGHTGGTLDKLELFKGLRTELSIAEAERVVDKVGAVVIAQTKELVPADKALYKLRDETNTVKSLPLIASSVVSKKLASGADVFVLDVKTGRGAFMETVSESVKLATLMVKILSSSGKKAAAIISDMNSPLGSHVGGVLEVGDALDVLGGKVNRLATLSLAIASHIISMAKGISEAEATQEGANALMSGRAERKFAEMVAAQGGATELFDESVREKYRENILFEVKAERAGYLASLNCVSLGFAARDAERQGAYGMYAPFKIGNYVEAGESLFTLYGKKPVSEDIRARLEKVAHLVEAPISPLPLVYDVVKG